MQLGWREGGGGRGKRLSLTRKENHKGNGRDGGGEGGKEGRRGKGRPHKDFDNFKDLINNLLTKRILQHKNNRITTKKHFRNITIFVDGLGLLLTLSCLGSLGPHFFYIFEDHVTMTIEGFHTTKEFFVVAAVDENLGVVFD